MPPQRASRTPASRRAATPPHLRWVLSLLCWLLRTQGFRPAGRAACGPSAVRPPPAIIQLDAGAGTLRHQTHIRTVLVLCLASGDPLASQRLFLSSLRASLDDGAPLRQCVAGCVGRQSCQQLVTSQPMRVHGCFQLPSFLALSQSISFRCWWRACSTPVAMSLTAGCAAISCVTFYPAGCAAGSVITAPVLPCSSLLSC